MQVYANPTEFRDFFRKHLDIEIRKILANQNSDAKVIQRKPIADIQLEFADPKTDQRLGATIAIETEVLEIGGFDEIPDYVPPQPENKLLDVSKYGITFDLGSNVNED